LFEPPAFWVVGASDRTALPDLTMMIELTRELLPTSTPTDAQLVRFQCALGNCAVTPPAGSAIDRQNWDTRRAALRGLSAVSSHTDRVARLQAFRRPVLIITGSSTVPFHRRINEILAQHLPAVERAEVSGGHTAPVTAIEEFTAKVKAFIIRGGG
jgi:pimeloyl-ACP methyl ester carboxylesterase